MNPRQLALFLCLFLPMVGFSQDRDLIVLPDAAETNGGPVLSEALEVRVVRIDVDGITAIDVEKITELTTQAQYLGDAVPSAKLQELRLALSNLYIDEGYVNSGVILPDQSIVEGVIRYQAIEGELSRIEIEDNPYISDRYIEGRLKRHISEPVHIEDIQYALQYLQNDPNIERLDARLAPGDGLGKSVLRIRVDEPTRFRLTAGGTNHRATSTGEAEATLSITSRNLTTLGDVLSLSTSVSDGANNESIGFTVPLSSRNTSLQLYASDSDSSIVEARLKTLDIASLTETRGVRLSHPFIDSLSETLAVSMGYESRYSESSIGGIPFSLSPGAIDGVSSTNVALLGVDWTTRGDNHVLTGRVNLRHGDDYSNATVFQAGGAFADLLDPIKADGLFDLVQTQVLYLLRPSSDSRGQFVVRASGQFSADPLMSIEKIAIGGVNTVRGYPENFLVRDNGMAVSLEYRLRLFGDVGTPGIGNLTIVPFLDYGRSWDVENTNRISSTRDTSDTNSIVSVGFGLVWAPVQGLNAQVFWGSDVHNDLAPGEDPRDFRDSNVQDKGVHFAVSYSMNW